MSKIKNFFLLVLPMFFTQVITFGQCSMCKATAEAGSQEAIEGLNHGILYLMILPYILIGGIVIAILVTLYKRRQEA